MPGTLRIPKCTRVELTNEQKEKVLETQEMQKNENQAPWENCHLSEARKEWVGDQQVEVTRRGQQEEAV